MGSCVWKNEGNKNMPFWFTVGCTGQKVNARKAMRKGTITRELKCSFCGKEIDFRGADNAKIRNSKKK